MPVQRKSKRHEINHRTSPPERVSVFQRMNCWSVLQGERGIILQKGAWYRNVKSCRHISSSLRLEKYKKKEKKTKKPTRRNCIRQPSLREKKLQSQRTEIRCKTQLVAFRQTNSCRRLRSQQQEASAVCGPKPCKCRHTITI